MESKLLQNNGRSVTIVLNDGGSIIAGKAFLSSGRCIAQRYGKGIPVTNAKQIFWRRANEKTIEHHAAGTVYAGSLPARYGRGSRNAGQLRRNLSGL